MAFLSSPSAFPQTQQVQAAMRACHVPSDVTTTHKSKGAGKRSYGHVSGPWGSRGTCNAFQGLEITWHH